MIRTSALRWILICGVLASCSSKHASHYRPDDQTTSKSRMLAIATSEPLVNQAAAEVFEAGGNLADAAVAASFAISVVRPQSTGIGGGGFLIFKPKGSAAEAWDFRETAPRRAHRKMFVRNGKADPKLSLNGSLAVATPGLVAGLSQFHQRHGKLSWKQVIAPAIRLAEEGVPVSKHMAEALKTRWNAIERDPAMMSLFSTEGRPLREGEMLLQRDLAQSLKAIASRGAQEFYRGEIAHRISSYIEANGGILSLEDLRRYQVKRRDVLKGSWRNLQVITMPPPSSGGLHLLQILKMTEQLPVPGALAATTTGQPERDPAIWEIEAFKRAYADRAFHLGDPDFHPVPVKTLLSDSYLRLRAQEILSGQILPSIEISHWKDEAERSKQTSHLSLMDQDGNAIATTQTLNYLFGAAVMASGTGVVLNDEMDDFSIEPGVANVFGLIGGAANEVQPLKRPLSSMTPTIVLDQSGNPQMVIGAPGGSRIITGVYKVIANHLREGLDPDTSMSRCRFHHQWSPDKVLLESRCGSLSSVLSKHYTIEEKDSVFGEVQLVGRKPSGEIFALADPRGHGRGEIFVFPRD